MFNQKNNIYFSHSIEKSPHCKNKKTFKTMFFILCLVFLITFALSAKIYASTFDDAYQEGTKAANGNKNTANNAIGNFNKNYDMQINSNPSEAKYYGGVTQSNTNMTNDAFKTIENPSSPSGEAGAAVNISFMTRPMYEVDLNSPGMQKSKEITHDADAISHGQNGQYMDCTAKPMECTTTYTNQTCQQSMNSGNISCTKDLQINSILTHEKQDVMVTGSSSCSNDNDFKFTFTIDLTTGQYIADDNDINHTNSKCAHLDFSALLKNMPCINQKTTYSVSNSNKYLETTINQLPTCANGYKLIFTMYTTADCRYKHGEEICERHGGNTKISLYFEGDAQELNEHWVDNCASLEEKAKNQSCILQSEACTQGQETKYFDGTPITRDCWQKTSNYFCSRTTSTVDTCTALISKGCEQIGSVCSQKSGDECLQYQQTYRCPNTKCSNSNEMICNNGTTFCLDGSCTDHSYTQSDDFDQAVSALSAVAEASKELEDNFIFKGYSESCRDDDIVGYSNCCSDSGWGQDFGLAGCNDAEKKLGEDKQKGLVTYVGRYCDTEVLGVCISYKKSYCTFQTMLAQIVQEQGRGGQLHLGFGDPEHPNCSGITPEQLEMIDFDKLDFTKYYSTLESQTVVPNTKEEEDKINQHINENYNNGKWN